MRKMYLFSLLKAFCFAFLFYVTFPISLFAQSNPVILGSGNGDVNVTTSHNEGTATGDETIDGMGLLPNLSSASRFFGASQPRGRY